MTVAHELRQAAAQIKPITLKFIRQTVMTCPTVANSKLKESSKSMDSPEGCDTFHLLRAGKRAISSVVERLVTAGLQKGI